ncbi:hypothetical protein GCM10007880_38340 [Mesorhizobium amorphae]|nr:hypothetical protein GCM10007880_38340 [Mesorhizobium amorphae]
MEAHGVDRRIVDGDDRDIAVACNADEIGQDEPPANANRARGVYRADIRMGTGFPAGPVFSRRWISGTRLSSAQRLLPARNRDDTDYDQSGQQQADAGADAESVEHGEQ